MGDTAAMYFLGVDGGNSKTIALVCDAAGRVLGAGRGGCADIYAPPAPEAALGSVDAAVGAALASAGLPAGQVASAAFSMAGADWPEDFEFLRSAFTKRGYGGRVCIVNDAIGAVMAGSPRAWGASVVCGTGGTAGARSPAGKTWHGGFWHDSSGGGGTLGEAAIRAVVRAELGIDPPTALTASLLQYYGQESVEAMLHAQTRRADRVDRRTAGLARLVLDAAAQRDIVATAIVRQQAELAAGYVLAGARIVGIAARPFDLVLAGGVLRHPAQRLGEWIVENVRKRAEFRPIRVDMEPVAGAVLVAMESAGLAIGAELRRRLQETHPPASLFET